MRITIQGWTRRVLGLGALALLATAASGATFKPAQLVRDINTTLIPVGSHPYAVCSRGDFTTLLTQDDGGNSKLWRTAGSAATTTLLKDLGTTGLLGSCAYSGTSGPQFFVLAGTGQFELWATDGTSAGTVRLLQTGDTYLPALAGVAGKPVFAVGQSDGTTRLYSSDGTVAGTALITTLPTTANDYLDLANRSTLGVNGRIFFGAGGDLWQTDGTASGTSRIRTLSSPDSVSPSVFLLEPFGNRFLFARQEAPEIAQLWISDGTAAGTQLLATFNGGQSSTFVTELLTLGTNRAIVNVWDGSVDHGTLLRTDGTPAGTQAINGPAGTFDTRGYAGVRVAGGALLPIETTDYGTEPWFTDGTDAGTHLVRDLFPGPGGSSYAFYSAAGGAIGYQLGAPSIQDLWFTDGSAAGTWSLNARNPLLSAERLNFYRFTAVGSDYLFWTDSDQFRLWRAQPATQTLSLIRTFAVPQNEGYEISLSQDSPGHAGGKPLFAMFDPVQGSEPWTTDGTTAGTAPIADLAPQVANESSGAVPLFALDGIEMFAATDNAQQRGLWRTDGTAAGTSFVGPVVPASDYYGVHTVRRGASTYFVGTESDGALALWRTDGTAGGTARVQPLGGQVVFGSIGTSCGEGFASTGNNFYFGANSQSASALYRSDGTAAGTTVMGLFPNSTGGPGGDVCLLAASAGELYFSASDATSNQLVLWRSNGLAGGHTPVLSASGKPFTSVTAMRVLGSAVLFTGISDGVRGLWRVASAGAAPSLVFSHGTAGVMPALSMESLDPLVLYVFCDNSSCHLYRSDGSAAGTFELTGPSSSSIQPWSRIAYNGKLLYQAIDANGAELWTTDGSIAGTRLLKDLSPGPAAAKPRDFINFNGLVYFQFDVLRNGFIEGQLWRTDGTEVGTEIANSTPSFDRTSQTTGYPVRPRAAFGVAGDRLYLAGLEAATGAELWQVENEAPATGADSATTQAGTATTLSVLANDSDGDGTLVSTSLRVAQGPANGTTAVDGATGSIRYAPNSGFSGTDSFSYQVADRQGRFSAATSVTITVAAATVTGGGGSSGGSGGSGGGGPVGLVSLPGLFALLIRRLSRRKNVPGAPA